MFQAFAKSLRTSTRANDLSFAGMSSQGFIQLVLTTISCTALFIVTPFFAVAPVFVRDFVLLVGVASRSWKRLSCSSGVMARIWARMTPWSHQFVARTVDFQIV